MERDLPATSGEISLSISLFILIQGFAPIMWSSISEVKGRKVVYIVSIAIFTVGSIIVSDFSGMGMEERCVLGGVRSVRLCDE